MARDTCRLPGCDEQPELGKFCSEFHELKYEHIKDDARDARLSEREDRAIERDPGMSQSEFRRMVL